MAIQPKWDTEDTIVAGNKMIELLNEHEAKMVDVLMPGAKEGLVADVAILRDDSFATSVATTQRKAATADQNKLLASGAMQVSAWREAIRRTYPDSEGIKKAFGVGGRVSKNTVKSVGRAMKVLVEAATEMPDIAREAAILPSHVQTMSDTIKALTGSDETQGVKFVSEGGVFQQRRDTQVRVERSMERIVAAATMKFMGQPLADEFRNVLPTRKRKSTKKRATPKTA